MDAQHYLSGWLGPEPISWLLSAGAFALAMSATPGPNNAMLAASGANFGFGRSLPHMLGVALGFALMIALIGLGCGSILLRFPLINSALKWVASAYLLWLAWRIATALPVLKSAAGQDQSADARRPVSFIQAALFQWVNPKAWVGAISAISVYTSALRPVLPQALALASLFTLVCLPSVALWTGIGAGAAKVLRTPTGLRAFNLVMAALLAASLVSLFIER